MGEFVDELSRELRRTLTTDGAVGEADCSLDRRRDEAQPPTVRMSNAHQGRASAGRTSTPRVFVVTCAVPPGAAKHLRVEVAGRKVTVVHPGFRQTLELPAEVSMEQLGWQVYANVLELRAPYRDLPPGMGEGP